MTFAIIAGSVIAGGAAVYGAKQAGKAAQRGADRASAESARQFDLVRSDTAPQRALGVGASDTLARLYGWAPPSQAAGREQYESDRLIGDAYLPSDATLVSTDGGRNRYYDVMLGGNRIGSVRPGGSNGRFTPADGVDVYQLMRQRQQQQAAQPQEPGKPDMSAFFESPDYKFNLAEGQKAIDRSLAARGGALSGRGVKEGERYASGLASGEFSNFTNRLLQIAGLGSAAVSTSANAGMTSAGQIGAAQMNAGNTRASAYMTGAQGVNNAVQGGISNYMLMQYLKQQPAVLNNSGTMANNYGGPVYGGYA